MLSSLLDKPIQINGDLKFETFDNQIVLKNDDISMKFEIRDGFKTRFG